VNLNVFATNSSVRIEYSRFLRLSQKERASSALLFNALHPEYSEPLKTGFYVPGARVYRQVLCPENDFESFLEALSLQIHARPRLDILNDPNRHSPHAFFPLLNWGLYTAYGPRESGRLARDFANFQRITADIPATDTLGGPNRKLTGEAFTLMYCEIQKALEMAASGATGFALFYAGEKGLPA
jgi:hypothetical protein